MDVTIVVRAVSRTARAQWVSDWPRSWYSGLMEGTLPGPVTQLDRATAMDVHQLRTGHWSGSVQYITASA